MNDMNKKRQAIFDKSGGKCWYCGCDLQNKRWHEDHLKPVLRGPRRGKSSVLESSMQRPENDTEQNKVPACAPCNLFKTTFSIEELRSEIAAQVERARKSSVNFRTAERFGLIKTIDKPVEFWFESKD